MSITGETPEKYHLLWRYSAADVIELLKTSKVTPDELLDVVEARLRAVEGRINAVPVTCLERARATARALKPPTYRSPGYLYGLPIVVKDSTPVKGVRWTSGSRLFADRIATEDDCHIENLERNGAIIIGKSNLPELGAGGTTYNDVFGETRNPWDLGKTCGGSSGGTAAALAAGEVWLGTGADLGGSLRIPAAFCGVVGMRCSVGLVPQRPAAPERVHTVSGPMARSVADLALMLDAMAGQHPRDPLSLPSPRQSFQAAICEGAQPPLGRIAWTPDLGGCSPVDPEVAAVCEKAACWFASTGAEVVRSCPDLSDADSIFQVLRAESFSQAYAGIKQDAACSPLLKPELHWQIDKGMLQSRQQVEEAERARAALEARLHAFLEEFELLCTPTVMMPAFEIACRWPESCGGRRFSNYVEWLLPTFAFSLADVPALSLPVGVTAAGLPVGLQIVGRRRADFRVLFAAAQYERAHSWRERVPLDPRRPSEDGSRY